MVDTRDKFGGSIGLLIVPGVNLIWRGGASVSASGMAAAGRFLVKVGGPRF